MISLKKAFCKWCRKLEWNVGSNSSDHDWENSDSTRHLMAQNDRDLIQH